MIYQGTEIVEAFRKQGKIRHILKQYSCSVAHCISGVGNSNVASFIQILVYTKWHWKVLLLSAIMQKVTKVYLSLTESGAIHTMFLLIAFVKIIHGQT